MSKTWSHARLGSFTYDADRDGWVGACELPGFKIFTLKPRNKKAAVSNEFFIESPDGKTPSSKLVTLAEKVITNHVRLAAQIAPALLEKDKAQSQECGGIAIWSSLIGLFR